MFEFKILDLHYIIKHDDLGETYKVPKEDIWMTFPFAIDFNSIKIECVRGDVLLEPDGDDYKYIQCTRVYLSDGSYVFAKLQYDTFMANLKAYKDSLSIEST